MNYKIITLNLLDECAWTLKSSHEAWLAWMHPGSDPH